MMILQLLVRIYLVLMLYCFITIQASRNLQKILSIEANCTRDLMHLKIDMGRQFFGKLFAKGFMDECASHPGSTLLTLPLTSCGIRSKMLSKYTMQYSVQIIAQHSSKLQQKSDIEVNAKCVIPTDMIDFMIEGSAKKSLRNGRMRLIKSEIVVRSWLDIETKRHDFGLVGENVTISAVAILPRNIGMQVVDCIAFDGIGDSSQKLFDEFGCPIDQNIMPNFKERLINFEDGWSKLDDHDNVQKVWSSTFQAFKFPDKDIIHFNCGIILCEGECSNECHDSLENKIFTKPLARLEIFNSLKVIAPQIEIDLPMEKNFTTKEFPEAHHSAYLGPDVLCVSQSKLALAFCVLGIIFLLAVIVAILCSIRYLTRRRLYRRSIPSSDSCRRSIFSLSSSSNNFSQSSLEIDSKLFAYGRVY